MSRPVAKEPERRRGAQPRCDHHNPVTGEVCDAPACYGFGPEGYQGVKPHPLEKSTCPAHRAWGEAYWRTLNGKG